MPAVYQRRAAATLRQSGPLPIDPVALVLERLDGVRAVGADRWVARCPSHRDRTPSLSVARGRGGDVLLHCFAGCDTAAVLARIGLTWRDLFTGEGRP